MLFISRVKKIAKWIAPKRLHLFIQTIKFKAGGGSSSYWEKRYADGLTSGIGSYGRLAVFKADTINSIISNHRVSTVIELGCGDGNQIEAIFPNGSEIKYLGYDISKTAIDFCQNKFIDDISKDFVLIDIMRFSNRQSIISADMAMSLDVIYHLIEDDIYEKYMHNLFSLAKKVVIIYSADEDVKNDIAAHVRRRQFTGYVKDNFPEWELNDYIKNRYPYMDGDSETSFSDFFVFTKTTLQ